MSRIGLRWCLTCQSLEGVRLLAGSAGGVLLCAPPQSILGVATTDCFDDGGVSVHEMLENVGGLGVPALVALAGRRAGAGVVRSQLYGAPPGS